MDLHRFYTGEGTGWRQHISLLIRTSDATSSLGIEISKKHYLKVTMRTDYLDTSLFLSCGSDTQEAGGGLPNLACEISAGRLRQWDGVKFDEGKKRFQLVHCINESLALTSTVIGMGRKGKSHDAGRAAEGKAAAQIGSGTKMQLGHLMRNVQ